MSYVTGHVPRADTLTHTQEGPLSDSQVTRSLLIKFESVSSESSSKLGLSLWTSLYCPVLARILLSQFNQNPTSSVSDHP